MDLISGERSIASAETLFKFSRTYFDRALLPQLESKSETELRTLLDEDRSIQNQFVAEHDIDMDHSPRHFDTREALIQWRLRAIEEQEELFFRRLIWRDLLHEPGARLDLPIPRSAKAKTGNVTATRSTPQIGGLVESLDSDGYPIHNKLIGARVEWPNILIPLEMFEKLRTSVQAEHARSGGWDGWYPTIMGAGLFLIGIPFRHGMIDAGIKILHALVPGLLIVASAAIVIGASVLAISDSRLWKSSRHFRPEVSRKPDTLSAA